MTTRTQRIRGPKPKFHVGDRVTFRLADYPFHGVISEDRGPLGVGGRRIYQIQAVYGDEVLAIELGESSLSFDASPSNGSGQATRTPNRNDDTIFLPARLPSQRRKGEPKSKYQVGDHVAFHFVNRTVNGIISEDMGPIGVKGRRLFHVVPDDPTETPEQFLVPEEDLSAAPGK